MAGADLLRRGVLLLIVLVVPLDVLRRDLDPLADRLNVDQRVSDLAFLGDAVVVLLLLEPRGNLRIVDLDRLAEFVDGQ